jgi:hypothetical protein
MENYSSALCVLTGESPVGNGADGNSNSNFNSNSDSNGDSVAVAPAEDNNSVSNAAFTIISRPSDRTATLCQMLESHQDKDAIAFAMNNIDELRDEGNSQHKTGQEAILAKYRRETVKTQLASAAKRDVYISHSYVKNSPNETLSTLHVFWAKDNSGEEIENVILMSKPDQQAGVPGDSGVISYNATTDHYLLDNLCEHKTTATDFVPGFTDCLKANAGHNNHDSPNIPSYHVYLINPEGLGKDIVKQYPNVPNAELGLR